MKNSSQRNSTKPYIKWQNVFSKYCDKVWDHRVLTGTYISVFYVVRACTCQFFINGHLMWNITIINKPEIYINKIFLKKQIFNLSYLCKYLAKYITKYITTSLIFPILSFDSFSLWVDAKITSIILCCLLITTCKTIEQIA